MEQNVNTPSGRPQRRPRKRSSILGTIPLVLCIVAIGLVYLLTGCFGLNRDSKVTANTELPPPPLASSETESPEARPSEIETEAPTSDAFATETPEEPTEAPTEETEPPEPDTPVFTTVDKHYFEDALFIGDSRTNGLEIYDPPSYSADFYCGTSMTIFGVLDSDETVDGVSGFRNVLQAKQYGKVYIMFGINECGYDTDYFLSWYRSVVETIRQYQPDALIYIQSILYVTQNRENADSVFSSDNLKEKNAGLKELANDKDIFYLEVNDALNDGTDHLPSDYTGDGVHLKANYYYLWRDYLYEHAIVDAAHPFPVPEETPETTEAESDAG